MKADGRVGGTLIVGEFPGHGDDQLGRPFSGETGAVVRRIVSTTVPGEPVVYDYAVRCPGDRVSARASVDQCRGYLAQVIADVQPKRIIALGPTAAQALVGRAIGAGTVHQAYSWTKVGDTWVPVFLLADPLGAARNRFLKAGFTADLKWALTAQITPSLAVWNGVTRIITTAAESQAACDEMRAAGGFTLDGEWAGRTGNSSFRMLTICAVADGTVDAWNWPSTAIYNPDVIAPFVKLARDRKVKKTGHGIKADVLAIYNALGIWLRGVHFDTLLVGKMFDGETDGYLETAAERVGMGGHKQELEDARAEGLKRFRKWVIERASKQIGLFGRRTPDPHAPPIPEYPDLTPVLAKELEEGLALPKFNHRSHSFALVPQDVLIAYNARDTVATSLLGVDLQAEAARSPALSRAWANLLRPAVEAMAQVEAWGVAADRNAAQALSDYLGLQQAEIRQRFVGYGYDPANPKGGAFNPNSDADVAKLLFGRLGLPKGDTTPTGDPSVAAEVLEAIYKIKAHPVLRDLIEDRKIGKSKATYADAILRFIRQDGRIHGNINLDGTRTGRLSIDSPSLQNLPRYSSELGRLIRNCFTSSPGHLLLELDYSQVEIRIAAGLSGDPVMLALLRSGEDFHLRTAKLISRLAWGIAPEDVTDYHRTLTKTINFGLLFGKDEYGLSFELGCSVQVAKKIKDAIFGQFHVLEQWIQNQVQQARRDGGIWTWWDGAPCRWRPLREVGEPPGFNDEARKSAERSAYNTPIQGTANEFCLRALVEVVEWITENGIPAKLVLTIHDALYLDVREDAVDEVHLEVNRIMTRHRTPSDVPLVVDAKSGTRLGEMKKRKLPASVAA